MGRGAASSPRRARRLIMRRVGGAGGGGVRLVARDAPAGGAQDALDVVDLRGVGGAAAGARP